MYRGAKNAKSSERESTESIGETQLSCPLWISHRLSVGNTPAVRPERGLTTYQRQFYSRNALIQFLSEKGNGQGLRSGFDGSVLILSAN